jgi:hypothetical protein
MFDLQHIRLGRRPAIRRALVVAGGLGASLGLVGTRPVTAQPAPQLTVSGGGVNVKHMPSPDSDAMVPLRESFAFDAYYAQCIVEDNPAPFAMDTYEMGRVVIEPHTFFMAMYSIEMGLVSIRRGVGNLRTAKLAGQLGCSTEVGTAETTLGSREATESAFFEIEAVDGGHGGGAVGDSFAFTVFFDPGQAPFNHAIFGPKFTFTGDMVAGEVTIAAPTSLPLVG